MASIERGDLGGFKAGHHLGMFPLSMKRTNLAPAKRTCTPPTKKHQVACDPTSRLAGSWHQYRQ